VGKRRAGALALILKHQAVSKPLYTSPMPEAHGIRF
jgi:hypothetical protein